MFWKTLPLFTRSEEALEAVSSTHTPLPHLHNTVLEPKWDIEHPPHLPVLITQAAKRKTASAQIKGTHIRIVIPSAWPKRLQKEVVERLSHKIQTCFNRDWHLVYRDTSRLLTFEDAQTLESWVTQVNEETLQVRFTSVRKGSARYSRLAQMNIKTRVMTVSQYCLTNVPESALRYLVIHELAHLNVANHSAAFWVQVKPFVTNLAYQKRLIQAVHRIRLYESSIIH